MTGDMLKRRIDEYSPVNSIEQENVIQEIMQQYILSSLSRAGFFNTAMFHGGTCLRIIFGTNRFSEDLDFLLKTQDPDFRWSRYLHAVQDDCIKEGIDFTLKDKSQADTAVQKVFLKTDSIGKIIALTLPFSRQRDRKINIKLEIDTIPPVGSTYETHYITFPIIAPLTVQSLQSGFALKAHALLCRKYIKGRDWYDYVWYISKKIQPNLKLLQNALHQQGPWAGNVITVTKSWLIHALEVRIREIDWRTAKQDVQRFLPSGEQESIQEWNADFFLYLTARL